MAKLSSFPLIIFSPSLPASPAFPWLPLPQWGPIPFCLWPVSPAQTHYLRPSPRLLPTAEFRAGPMLPASTSTTDLPCLASLSLVPVSLPSSRAPVNSRHSTTATQLCLRPPLPVAEPFSGHRRPEGPDTLLLSYCLVPCLLTCCCLRLLVAHLHLLPTSNGCRRLPLQSPAAIVSRAPPPPQPPPYLNDLNMGKVKT